MAPGFLQRLDSVHLLQVIRHDYAGDIALGLGDAHSAVDQLANPLPAK
jgi:hypothetical protein